MSYSFPSHTEAKCTVMGHDDVSDDGMPFGGFAVCKPQGHVFNEQPLFHIKWQNGPVDRERGQLPNGAFVEDVLEVCFKRLEAYEKSKFPSESNRTAMEHIQKAIAALNERKEDRKRRGVYGKNEK